MVGAVIIAHGSIGRELIMAAEYILGKIEGITAVSIDFNTNAFEARRTISEAIRRVDEGEGVLLMTDLFGGSPSNIAYSFLTGEKIDVITGVNLPMILTFWNKRAGSSLPEIGRFVTLSGMRAIARAKDLTETEVVLGRSKV